MPQTKIEIVLDAKGQVNYTSPFPPAITIFYLEFVKFDLLSRQREPRDKKQIVIPEIIPTPRPEG